MSSFDAWYLVMFAFGQLCAWAVTSKDLAYIDEVQAKALDNVTVQKDDILLNITGASVARCCLAPNKYLPARVNQHVAIVRVRPQVADAKFVLYCINSLHFKKRLLALAQGGATREALTKTTIEDFEVPQPPLPTQRRIASILSAYDELIGNNQRRIRILEDMARSLYREWFVHFRYPGHESAPLVDSPIGQIPQQWEVKAIQQFGKVITGKTPSKANADFYGEDVPFVKTPDMHGNMFILSTGEKLSIAGAESQTNKTIPAGSLCVSCIGTIGVVSITTEDCQTNQQINSVVLFNENYREFLFFHLQESKQAMENLGSNGATMGNVNKSKFESMKVVAPPDALFARYTWLLDPSAPRLLSEGHLSPGVRREARLDH
jgi:type I restriction enzyme S subunit